jgi:3-hydroxyisobutyrate dehydrogenase-like beta-hydroxyacid dehydrogenase
MTSKIAFIGLGHMGTPIATRLIRAGHHVTVWDRDPAARSSLRRQLEPAMHAGAGDLDFSAVIPTILREPAHA